MRLRPQRKKKAATSRVGGALAPAGRASTAARRFSTSGNCSMTPCSCGGSRICTGCPGAKGGVPGAIGAVTALGAAGPSATERLRLLPFPQHEPHLLGEEARPLGALQLLAPLVHHQ